MMIINKKETTYFVRVLESFNAHWSVNNSHIALTCFRVDQHTSQFRINERYTFTTVTAMRLGSYRTFASKHCKQLFMRAKFTVAICRYFHLLQLFVRLSYCCLTSEWRRFVSTPKKELPHYSGLRF